MPLAIRQAFLNIIPILFWQGHVVENFNNIIKNHLSDLIVVLKNGIRFQIGSTMMEVKVFIECLIGDSPGEAKMANTKQFNGKFGCIRCLNSGKRLKRSRIYEYKPNVQLRTNDLYLRQVCEAVKIGKSFEGIKGENILSTFCSFPDSVLIDSMHLLGVVKQLLSLWFDSKNSDNEFYLG